MIVRPRLPKYKKCPQCGSDIRYKNYESHVTSRCEKRLADHPHSDIFPRTETPDWLLTIVEKKSLPSRIPICDVIKDCCFYPASGLDASPILIANGFIHSFIYCDYGINEKEFNKDMAYDKFRGYKKIMHKTVVRDEIVSSTWIPQMPNHFDQFNGFNLLLEAQRKCQPFGDWSIWERDKDNSESHGPKYFSFLFLAGEGIATYQGLFLRNHNNPKILALIQPGHAFGGNWTNFLDEGAPLWQFVIKGDLPEYVLIGSYYHPEITNECNFPGYEMIKSTITYELKRTEYIYNEKGDSTPLLLSAMGLAEKTKFDIRQTKTNGISRSVSIYRKTNNSISS